MSIHGFTEFEVEQLNAFSMSININTFLVCIPGMIEIDLKLFVLFYSNLLVNYEKMTL